MTHILLVRHGETDWNKEHRLQGHIDIPLNQVGIEQALLLAKALEEESIDLAYTSDLSRAFDTANAITKNKQIPTFIDRGLRERCYGEVQGLTHTEIEEKLPENYQAWQTRNPDFQPKNGESLREFFARVEQTCLRIAQTHTGKKVLIVAHGGVLDCMYRIATNTAIHRKRRIPLLNTSLNRLHFQNDKFHIQEWGDISHLDLGSALDEVDGKVPERTPWVLP